MLQLFAQNWRNQKPTEGDDKDLQRIRSVTFIIDTCRSTCLLDGQRKNLFLLFFFICAGGLARKQRTGTQAGMIHRSLPVADGSTSFLLAATWRGRCRGARFRVSCTGIVSRCGRVLVRSTTSFPATADRRRNPIFARGKKEPVEPECVPRVSPLDIVGEREALLVERRSNSTRSLYHFSWLTV